jgi:MYXO-CTERM domain-containing protein
LFELSFDEVTTMLDRLVLRVPRHCALAFSAAVAFACSAPDASEPVDSVAQAIDICNEVVPANRAVDGIPAYAQCDATMNSSIWSNNGVDTSLTSLGSDWVQTQRDGGYQCTELVYRYMRFRWNVSYRSGDAQEWCDGNLPANLVKSTTPVHGDLIVFAGGVCGAAESTGHIAIVDTVDAARATVTIVEENRAGRRSVQQSCATCFLHATANDGSGGGAAGMGGAPNMGGASSMGGARTTGGAAGRGGAAGTGGTETGGSVGTAGAGGVDSGGTSAGGAGSAGRAGVNTGGASMAGNSGLGASGGSSATTGGGPTSGGAGGTAGAMTAAGTPGVAGAGDAPEPEGALDSGCSVSSRPSPLDGSAAVALGLLLGAFARRRKHTLG